MTGRPNPARGRVPWPGALHRLLAGAGGGPAGRCGGLEDHLRLHGPVPLPPGGPRRGGHGPLVSAVEAAGLTGRGGAGFPTARKLRGVAGGRRVPVVVANGMESEPASRKDAVLLDVAPHLVLDGAVLAAAAVGADVVHLCLARTRPRQADRMERAVQERRRAGLGGAGILVHRLPHHYVSSEESALVNWLNGGDARPTATPPRPFEKGVDRRPTLVDNVETLAHLALIARHGPRWFRTAGTQDAPGTVLSTVLGAVHRPGVYEVPAGGPLGALLHTAGGAAAPPAALLVGGFFGTWLPAGTAASAAYSARGLAPLDAGPGAGVVLVLPHGACGLAETAGILGHLAAHSAGQCGPCRFGLPAVADDFTALAAGRTDPATGERLRRRVDLLTGRGACRHPDGASRLASTALRVFAADAAAHLAGRPCAAAARPPLLDLPAPVVPEPHAWR